MAVDIRQSKTRTVYLRAPGTWTSPTATCYSPRGASLAAPTAVHTAVGSADPAVSHVSATVASSPTNAYTFSITAGAGSIAGATVGRWISVVYGGVAYETQITSSSSGALTVHPPLPGTPTAGAVVRGVEIAVTIPAAATGTIDPNHSLVVTCTEGTEARLVYHVVRSRVVDVVDAAAVRALVLRHWASAELNWAQVDELVGRTQQEIRAELLATGRYAYSYLDPDAVWAVAQIIVRYLLAVEYALYPSGTSDTQTYLDALERDRDRLMGRLVASLQAVDADQDGDVEEETTPERTAIRLVR